ncbi:Cat eye syndrome critical region protein 5 [Oryzias melastigma]|uniref:Haloacid dehalogenase-like hydrolase domain-containing 5 n=1 Tax=Oryzias melastigma TaxID=30732 RepID=A0A834C5Q3_ORYME|nr:Cat eye syndrome critical region protein 5 [Oryzias melastigma]
MQRFGCLRICRRLLRSSCEGSANPPCRSYSPGGTPIPAAKRIFRNLVDRRGQYKVPVVFVTNAGNCMRQAKAEHLSHLLEVEVTAIISIIISSLVSLLCSDLTCLLMQVSPDQVMLSHSPLRAFSQFHKKHVLVSGQGPVEDVAHNLGFEDIVTIDMLRQAYPVLDMVDQSRRPKDSIPPTRGLRPIEAIVLFGEPIRWETNLQLIVDVLLTNGDPDRPWSTAQHPHIPVLACNMDLLWMAEAKNPRFGHGMFLVCLENLYQKVTGRELKYEALIGKPSVVTYNYAELLIRQQAKKLGWSGPVKRLYAIGDNPMSDVYGANLYDQYLQAHRHAKAADAQDSDRKVELPEGCSSILVCTGVYSRDQQEAPSDVFHGHRDFRFDPGLLRPSFVVHDVKEALELVFQREGRPLE